MLLDLFVYTCFLKVRNHELLGNYDVKTQKVFGTNKNPIETNINLTMYISNEKLSDLHLGELTPGKVMDQLKFCPKVFNFLKSKEIALGKIRPIITYIICLSIWILRQTTTKKRKIPEGFFEALWNKFSANKKVVKLAGDIIEELEPQLWNFFLDILEKEIQRGKNITKKEIGTGGLIFAIVIMGLLYSFGNEETIQKLTTLISRSLKNSYKLNNQAENS